MHSAYQAYRLSRLGPRGCPKKALADAETSLTLAEIVFLHEMRLWRQVVDPHPAESVESETRGRFLVAHDGPKLEAESISMQWLGFVKPSEK